MNFIEKFKVKKTKKMIEDKMVELVGFYPMLDDLRLYIEACFSLFPEMKKEPAAMTTIMIQGFAIYRPVYYCEYLDDWVRIDEVRKAGPLVTFDLMDNKVTSNGVEAKLLKISNNKADVIKAYDEYKEAQK